MRSLEAGNIMIPVAAYSGLQSSDGATAANPMLSFNQSHFHAALSRAHASSKTFLGSGLQPGYFSFDGCPPLKPWTASVKESSHKETHAFELTKPRDLKCDKANKANNKDVLRQSLSSTILKDSILASSLSAHKPDRLSGKEAHRTIKLPQKLQFDTCGPQDTQMNNAEKLTTMTGSSNHGSELLGWISDIASKNASNSVAVDSDKIPCAPLRHNVNENSSTLLLSNSGSLYVPPLVLTRSCEASNVRMFTPPFQAERVRHLQRTSVPLSSTGSSPYYSQAPRTAPYSNFYHPAYPTTTSYHVSTSSSASLSSNPPESARSYLQVDNFTNLSSPNLQPGSIPHLQLPCSTTYLSHSSATGSHATPPLSPHARLFQQGRSILISRSPEGMAVHSSQERGEPCHIRVQLSPVSPQLQEEATRRKSHTSTSDYALGSSSCSPVLCDNAHTISRSLDFSASKDFRQHGSLSPSHAGYRLPTGKEGSLKHRILRPPSINIVDLPPSVVADAPLSAPPIRTHREPSPKQARSIPSSGYRSFSSSASSVSEAPFVNHISSAHGSPSLYPNHCSSLSSGSVSPVPLGSPGSTPQLKYPQSFMKGSIIQLANNQLKQVEHLTTEDFIECGLLSPTLKIDSSTVVTVEKMPAAGAAKLGFHVGQNNLQITVEAPLEHPFFVYKQGWSSCSPERSLQRYGLVCHKLKVGDVCISLTEKRRNTSNESQKSNEPLATKMPCPPTVPMQTGNENAASQSNPCKVKQHTFRLPYSLSEKSVTNINNNNNVSPPKQSTSVPSPEKSNSVCNETSSPAVTGKRKRRWSAPDNIVQNEDSASVAS